MSYVELHAHSAYSFLDGASLPEELAVRAAELGYEALALADGSHVTLLVETPQGYANLCRLLTAAHKDTRLEGREHELRDPALEQSLLEELNAGLVCLSGCARDGLA